jgi:hypothetical protein
VSQQVWHDKDPTLHRDILYFDQMDLKDTNILDVQWFSDAFKHVIAFFLRRGSRGISP